MKEPMRIDVPLDDDKVKKTVAHNCLLYVSHDRLLGIYSSDAYRPTPMRGKASYCYPVLLADHTYDSQQSRIFVDYQRSVF